MEIELKINFSDWSCLESLVARHEEFKVPLVGKNEDGESILITINKDNIITLTYQNNGWIRENIYWVGENMIEEIFHGRWQ